jgi:hypothetical protein
MMAGVLLWLLGVPLSVIILLWCFERLTKRIALTVRAADTFYG